MTDETVNALIEECILHLRVSEDEWDFIGILVLESIGYFQNIVSRDFDILEEKEIVKNRVRYAYHNALEDFIVNFDLEIERLQVKYAQTTENI